MMQATEPHAPTRNVAETGQSLLRTLLVCDLVDSTALVERIGDQQAANLLRKHDRLARALLEQHGGREIDRTDGFLLLFERPIQAVAFALDYQRDLKRLSVVEEMDLCARVGIHMGDVVVWENDAADVARGAKPFEVEGLAKPVAARLAALAQSGQILLSSVVASIARRAQDELSSADAPVQWKGHGRYRFKGLPEPLDVLEVGQPPVARFRTPPSGGAARKMRPWWRRPRVLAAEILALALVISIPLWVGIHSEPSLAFSARDWVVVGNLQNQTGDRRFDSSLDMAFRLGLQQSRYVNVIPEMRVRQTLMQMKRSPDVNVDRTIGTEVAQREHAKALILPSATNYGNGVRITAELIDPQTARAVASTSVDVDDRSDIVGAVDTLVRRLRGTLGESLAQIESSSVPLSQATTPNLEALRVFSLAERARGVGDFKLSLDLARHSIELDPDFASAYALIGADYLTLGQIGPAQKALEQALKRKDRLSQLELVKLQAQKISSLRSPVEAVAAWKMVSDLYPDQATGPHNVGIYTAAYLNDCESALPYLRHAAELPQPLRAVSLYIVATCELSVGEAKAAIRDFQTASDAGFRGPFLGLADAYVALYEYGKATDYLNHVSATAASASSLAIRRTLIAADQGDLPAAETFLVQGLQSTKAAEAAPVDWPLRLDLVAVLWAQGRSEAALAQTREDMHALFALDAEARGNLPFDYPTLIAAYSRWAARLGAPMLAERGIGVVRGAGVLQGYPIRSQLVAVAEAEMALRRGESEQAVRIAASADSHPLWEVLDVLARAKSAAGQSDAPAAFKRALDARQLALGELYENNLGICTRAIQWNLTLLGAAESLKESDKSAAAEYARTFLEHWSKAPSSLASIQEATHLLATRKSPSAQPQGSPQG